MKNWKLFPKNKEVARIVDCYWGLEKEEHDRSYNFPKLNPDPAAHLLLSNELHRYTNDQEFVVKGNHWLYPYQKTLTIDHRHTFKVIGIKFKVGALYALALEFLKADLNVITEVDINQLTGIRHQQVNEMLTDFDKPELIAQSLDSLLLPWVKQSHFDKHSLLVEKILPLLNSTTISELENKLHVSQRTLERSFQRVTHLTMKQCQSMFRLENILQYLYKKDDQSIDWTELAAEFEFSDQPHFIRSIKKVLGKTPTEYSKQRDLTIDIYGDFEFD